MLGPPEIVGSGPVLRVGAVHAWPGPLPAVPDPSLTLHTLSWAPPPDSSLLPVCAGGAGATLSEAGREGCNEFGCSHCPGPGFLLFSEAACQPAGVGLPFSTGSL